MISLFFHQIPNKLQQHENEEIDDNENNIISSHNLPSSSSSNNKFLFFSFHGQEDQIIPIFDALEFHSTMSQKCHFSSYFFPCGSNSDDSDNLSSKYDQNLIHFEEIENCFEVQNLNNLTCDHHFNGFEKLIADTIEEFINRHHAI